MNMFRVIRVHLFPSYKNVKTFMTLVKRIIRTMNFENIIIGDKAGMFL